MSAGFYKRFKCPHLANERLVYLQRRELTTTMAYWLFKTEPDAFSIDDLANRPEQTEPWDGVRNYQARNFLRDGVKRGDRVFIYHSSCKLMGIAGVAEVVRDLHRGENQAEQSYSERQMYQAALERLAGEFAAIEDIDKDSAASKLEGIMTAA